MNRASRRAQKKSENSAQAQERSRIAVQLMAAGDVQQAEKIFREIITAFPSFADGFHNYAMFLRRQGRAYEAVPAYQQLVALQPQDAEALFHLGSLLPPQQGVDFLQRAVMLAPQQDAYWLHYCEALRVAGKLPANPPVAALIERLRHPSQIAEKLTTLAQALLKPEAIDVALSDRKLRQGASDPLLLAVLKHQRVTDYALEQALTALRRRLLLVPPQDDRKSWLPVLRALAAQCARNEFLFFVSEEEQRALEGLSPAGEWEQQLAACYSAPKEADEPEDIPVLGTIQDDVSLAVRAQYEEHPYPRWEKIPELPLRRLTEELRAIFPHHSLIAAERPEILIAGCGTGRQVMERASRIFGCQVLATDLSRASLSYAKRKLREAGCTNVAFLQADILRLGELERQFDFIECCGVLHHMREPEAGWQVLTGILRPQGVMKIALYSTRARVLITEAREAIKQAGYPASEEGIRQFRHAAMREEKWQPLARYSDFFSMSECRDLLFHVQEHCFTPLQIGAMLERLGLEFLGFEHFDPRRFPPEMAQATLAEWDAYEAQYPDSFTAMLQFWVRKKPS